jgi:hypothetical protein
MIIGYVIAAALLECTLHHTSVTQPHGAPHDPVTNDELIAKFHAAGRPRHRWGSGAIERPLVGLDDLGNLSNLVDLLAAPV